MKLIFLLLVALISWTYGFDFLDHEYSRTPLGDAVDHASMKLLKEAYKEGKDTNIISSPLGILILLSMYSAGTSGELREEIIKALGSKDYNELFQSYTDLGSRLSRVDEKFLTLANKVYLSTEAEMAPEFGDVAVKSYHSEVESINFKNKKEAVDAINKWADQKTKGYIKNPISENDLSADAIAALVNVIFFQGQWHVPFNASETVDKDFHVNETTTVKKATMHLQQSLFYHESSTFNAKMIELPYKQQGFRMVVILPNEIDGLRSLVETVAEKGILEDVFSLQPSGRDVIFEMPKFEIKNKLDLNSLLPKVGVSRIFSDPATGILKDKAVVVDRALQEAFVKVDEEGATAGAFTGVVLVPMCSICGPPPAMEFKVDHPFLFAILYEEIVLFVGTYSH